jgi:hypothetical protein
MTHLFSLATMILVPFLVTRVEQHEVLGLEIHVKLSKLARDLPCRLLMSLPQFWQFDDAAIYCVRVVPDTVMV